MAWISVHEKVIGPKLRKLAKNIECSQNEALGILVRLWLWALNEADRDGSLKCVDEADVSGVLANGLRDGISAADVINALVDSEWLEYEDGIFYIHDWEDWQKQWYQLQDVREQNTRRQREYRRRRRRRTAERAEKTDAQSKPIAPGDTKEQESESVVVQTQRYTTGFEEFWKAYPRREGKGEAYKKYKARLNDGFGETELLTAAMNYAKTCSNERRETRFIKHAKTFLSDATPFLDFLPKQGRQPDENSGSFIPSS